VRFSPQAVRRRNALLFGWYQLVQDIAARPGDPGAARLKLDWWRQEATLIPSGEARHPLAIALQESVLDESSIALMTAMIDSADEEIRSAALADNEAFASVCRGSLGNLFRLLAELEADTTHPAEECLSLGGYCAAVERIRRLVEAPHRVPGALNPQTLRGLGRAERLERIETLLTVLRGSPPATTHRLPDFAARLTALYRALHSKMHRQGYPVSEFPIDRAPIAHLWTAWRCR
jgi:hypothetical protein